MLAPRLVQPSRKIQNPSAPRAELETSRLDLEQWRVELPACRADLPAWRGEHAHARKRAFRHAIPTVPPVEMSGTRGVTKMAHVRSRPIASAHVSDPHGWTSVRRGKASCTRLEPTVHASSPTQRSFESIGPRAERTCPQVAPLPFVRLIRPPLSPRRLGSAEREAVRTANTSASIAETIGPRVETIRSLVDAIRRDTHSIVPRPRGQPSDGRADRSHRDAESCSTAQLSLPRP